jgi:PspA associated protein B
VGLGDVLFGRKKLKGPARDRLFALVTAAVTLDVECGITSEGVAAVVFKPLSAGSFTQADRDVEQLIQSVAAEQGSKLDRRTDSFGYEWVIVHDPDLEDQVTAVYGIANGLTEKGFGGQLLAAVFRFEGPVYWVYGFKSGTFWPFIPTGGQERDNARELSLKAKLEKELPVEQDLSKWFALYDAPI